MKNEAKKPINILFASFEAEPFMKTGGLGDVAGTLPAYIAGAILGAFGFYGTSMMDSYMAYLVIFGVIGGIGTSGKVAVVLCFIILLAVALTHLPGKEEKA